ncbi:MAG: hypothetical protein R3F56_24790 [Planctomycetota bacterium]
MRRISAHEVCWDARGSIHVLHAGAEWRELVYVTSRAGSRRGDHYHAQCRELIVLLSGRASLQVRTVDGGQVHRSELGAMEGVVFEPGEAHALTAIEDTCWIAARSLACDPGADDMVRCVVEEAE